MAQLSDQFIVSFYQGQRWPRRVRVTRANCLPNVISMVNDNLRERECLPRQVICATTTNMIWIVIVVVSTVIAIAVSLASGIPSGEDLPKPGIHSDTHGKPTTRPSLPHVRC